MSDRVKVRLRFEKYGAMKFIGHLDVMRYFQKLIRRAGLDVAYSEGFHPHQILSFANPLGVGISSKGEYADLVMESVTSSKDMVDALNRENVEGFFVTDIVRLPENAPNGMASVDRADYELTLSEEKYPDVSWLEDACKALSQKEEVLIEKRTKKGMKTVDIKEGILELRCEGRVIFMKLRAGSALNIRPEQVLLAVFAQAGAELYPFSYDTLRLEQYDCDGKSLLSAGEVF
ncbi:MAG: TIGR03936 family radical SAM-associated protein [Lachnospiraceae bacterium]|nr:TIGR03936 family radical SAM-associated protein [Lachnospiraceae bacterium]